MKHSPIYLVGEREDTRRSLVCNLKATHQKTFVAGVVSMPWTYTCEAQYLFPNKQDWQWAAQFSVSSAVQKTLFCFSGTFILQSRELAGGVHCPGFLLQISKVWAEKVQGYLDLVLTQPWLLASSRTWAQELEVFLASTVQTQTLRPGFTQK